MKVDISRLEFADICEALAFFIENRFGTVETEDEQRYRVLQARFRALRGIERTNP